MSCWNKSTLRYYFEGLRWGTYPHAIMEKLAPHLQNCSSLTDICSGPGAFALWALNQGWQAAAVDADPIATQALTEEAGNMSPRLTVITDDLLDADLPSTDVSVAAWCFYRETSEELSLGKMIDAGRKLNIFVQHDGTQTPEFATQDLPRNKPAHVWEDNNMEGNLLAAAEKRGLKLNSFFITCDFGCIYHPGDEIQLDFIAQKTGVADRDLLKRHLEQNARPCPGGLWLPSPKPMKVIWIAK